MQTFFSLQNSIEKDDALARWAGRERAVGASIIEGGAITAPGHVINTLTTPTTAYFGELDGSISDRARKIADAFAKAGMGARAVDNITHVEWEKLTQIALASGFSVSTLAAVARLDFADGLVVREGAEHFVTLGKDLLSIYAALGYTPQNFFAPVSALKQLASLPFEEAVTLAMDLGRQLKARSSVARTSMHEDVVHGRKTEVDFIPRPFVEKAAALKINAPTVNAAYRVAKTIDSYLCAPANRTSVQ